MNIQIAGPGCQRCQATEQAVKKACADLDIRADITHEYDIKAYAKLGVRLTPAVLIDGTVVFSGRVPTIDEMKEILSKTVSETTSHE